MFSNGNGAAAPEVPAVARSAMARVIDIVTEKPRQFVNLTSHLQELVNEAALDTGLIHVQTLHTTTGLLLNEWQSALLHEFERILAELMPSGADWRHDDPAYSDCQRKNAAAHLRSLMLSPSLLLQVRRGRVVLGTWQNVILAELDGPRSRAVSVAIMPA